MSVTLRKRKNADGTTSLRLDIFHEGKRKIETLSMLQLCKPANYIDRQSNKEKLKAAEEIAVARALAIQTNGYSLTTESGKRTIITAWIGGLCKRVSEERQEEYARCTYPIWYIFERRKKVGLVFSDLTALTIEDFNEFLETKSKDEGALSYRKRFKKMLKMAYRKRLLTKNSTEFVERKIKSSIRKKDVLTMEEIQLLASTPMNNKNVHNAFLFCCVTGLRWCDVALLKWKDINLKEKNFKITKTKTDKELVIPLNETAVKLLGKEDKLTSKVFDLPTANGVNKSLKAWILKAGIDKKITLHNGRH